MIRQCVKSDFSAVYEIIKDGARLDLLLLRRCYTEGVLAIMCSECLSSKETPRKMNF